MNRRDFLRAIPAGVVAAAVVVPAIGTSAEVTELKVEFEPGWGYAVVDDRLCITGPSDDGDSIEVIPVIDAIIEGDGMYVEVGD